MVSFGKVLPGESNFAKAWEVYRSALAKFIVSNQTLPKLAKFMISFGKGSSRRIKLCQSLRSLWSALAKILPGESNFAKAWEVYGSALAKFIQIAYKK